MPPPKAILFDIGGVCVTSPMRAILDYELANNIPPGFINFSISRSAPHGPWHKLERGEIPMDAAFFKAFAATLQRRELWEEYSARVGAAKSGAGGEGSRPETPPLPVVDAEWLVWEMMRVSRQPDPDMFPVLRKLKASGRFLIAALSNTIIFPDGHPYNDPEKDPDLDVKGVFDVFVSSAHVGVRKPDPRIYELALERMRERYEGDLRAEDVVFLDDIGENLRQGKKLGFNTIKVIMGNTKGAIRELESALGMSLLDEAAKL